MLWSGGQQIGSELLPDCGSGGADQAQLGSSGAERPESLEHVTDRLVRMTASLCQDAPLVSIRIQGQVNHIHSQSF